MSLFIDMYLLLLSCFIDFSFDWLNLLHRGSVNYLWGLKDSIQTNLSPRLDIPDNPNNTDIDYFVSVCLVPAARSRGVCVCFVLVFHRVLYND